MATLLSNQSSLSRPRIAVGRVALATLGAIVASIVVNLLIMAMTRALFPIPAEFLPLSAPPIILFTTFFIAIAGLVFLLVDRLSRNPVRAYTIVAVIALVLSLVPDFGLLANPAGMPGATPAGVWGLIAMHVVSAVITVVALTRYGLTE
jgi:hypothetical protein